MWATLAFEPREVARSSDRSCILVSSSISIVAGAPRFMFATLNLKRLWKNGDGDDAGESGYGQMKLHVYFLLCTHNLDLYVCTSATDVYA